MSKLSVRLWITDQNPASPEALAVMARMPQVLTADEQTWIAAFVDSQVAINNWAIIDEFCLFSMVDAVNALTGWKQVTLTAGLSGTAGLTHIPNSGIDSLGTGSYQLNYFLSTLGFSQSIGDKNLGVYILENNDVAGAKKGIIGSTDPSSQIFAPDSTPQSYNGDHSGAPVALTADPSTPFALSINQAVATVEARVDGVVDNTAIGPDFIVTNQNYEIFRTIGGTSAFWEGKIAAWWSTGHAGFDYLAFQTSLETLLRNFGAIP